MSTDSGIIRKISWRDSCPWLMLVRVFHIASAPHVLLLATVGALVSSGIWRIADTVFPPAGVVIPAAHDQADSVLTEGVLTEGALTEGALTEGALTEGALTEGALAKGDITGDPLITREALQRWPGSRCHSAESCSISPANARNALLGRNAGVAPVHPIFGVATRYAMPFTRLLDRNTSWREIGFSLLGGVGSLLVWSVLGGAIVRIAAVDLGRQERVGLSNALNFSRSKVAAYFAAPLLPLAGIAAIAVPMIPLGWLMLTDFGVTIGGLVWLLVMIGAILMAIGAIGLLFGWPLMWGAIGAEGSDSFDAISRAYAYTFQRPFEYLFYALVATILGTLGWLLVWGFSEAVVTMAFWGTSWGAGSDRVNAVISYAGELGQSTLVNDPSDNLEMERPSQMFRLGASLIGLAVGGVRSVATGFAYSFFWCAAVGIYLLLRLSADSTELDEVYIDPDAESVYGLPELEQDGQGVPGVADEPEADEPAADEPLDDGGG